jgi:putative transposase
MASARLLAPDTFAHALYHCYSRVVDKRMIFGDAEKEQFVAFMRMYERLCGVRVLTFCVMGNHFHLLVEVPKPPEVPLTREKLILLVAESLGEETSRALSSRFASWEKEGNKVAMAQEMKRWCAQMWDLGRFMKMLKQCFSHWYNRRQTERRTGTLWEGRYHSVLVEDGEALQSMAMYIDLNPLRAGLVEDPKEYRWCGYGEAVAGQAVATASLARMAELSSPALAQGKSPEAVWRADILRWYRQALCTRGEQTHDAQGAVIRKGLSPDQVQAVRDAKGALPLHEYVRLRVRYFTCGLVLGSAEFVDSVFHQRREWFSKKRQNGARRLKGLDPASPLRTARDLVVKPFG